MERKVYQLLQLLYHFTYLEKFFRTKGEVDLPQLFHQIHQHQQKYNTDKTGFQIELCISSLM